MHLFRPGLVGGLKSAGAFSGVLSGHDVAKLSPPESVPSEISLVRRNKLVGRRRDTPDSLDSPVESIDASTSSTAPSSPSITTNAKGFDSDDLGDPSPGPPSPPPPNGPSAVSIQSPASPTLTSLTSPSTSTSATVTTTVTVDVEAFQDTLITLMATSPSSTSLSFLPTPTISLTNNMNAPGSTPTLDSYLLINSSPKHLDITVMVIIVTVVVVGCIILVTGAVVLFRRYHSLRHTPDTNSPYNPQQSLQSHSNLLPSIYNPCESSIIPSRYLRPSASYASRVSSFVMGSSSQSSNVGHHTTTSAYGNDSFHYSLHLTPVDKRSNSALSTSIKNSSFYSEESKRAGVALRGQALEIIIRMPSKTAKNGRNEKGGLEKSGPGSEVLEEIHSPSWGSVNTFGHGLREGESEMLKPPSEKKRRSRLSVESSWSFRAFGRGRSKERRREKGKESGMSTSWDGSEKEDLEKWGEKEKESEISTSLDGSEKEDLERKSIDSWMRVPEVAPAARDVRRRSLSPGARRVKARDRMRTRSESGRHVSVSPGRNRRSVGSWAREQIPPIPTPSKKEGVKEFDDTMM